MGGRRPRPELDLLALLVSVSEHGSLGAGARAVGMAQPNASRAIARFERSMGVALLRRSPRGSSVTAEGAVLVDWARDVLAAAERLLAGADALRSRTDARLTAAASMTVAEYLVPAWLTELRRAHPGLEVALEVRNSADVLAGVESGAYDVGFVESPDVPGRLHQVAVGQDELVVVVNPGHPWARRRKPVTADELARTPLVVREEGSGTRTALEAALAEHVVAAPALALASNAAVRLSVLTGAAPAVLSELAVDAALVSGELHRVPVEDLDLRRPLRAVWNGPRQLTGPAAELVQIAHDSARMRATR
jgi:DNA-binding transcriptional LysR family regulator